MKDDPRAHRLRPIRTAELQEAREGPPAGCQKIRILITGTGRHSREGALEVGQRVKVVPVVPSWRLRSKVPPFFLERPTPHSAKISDLEEQRRVELLTRSTFTFLRRIAKT